MLLPTRLWLFRIRHYAKTSMYPKARTQMMRLSGLRNTGKVPFSTCPPTHLTIIHYHSGILSKAKFYRVIADEAQFIRNRYAQGFSGSESCFYLYISSALLAPASAWLVSSPSSVGCWRGRLLQTLCTSYIHSKSSSCANPSQGRYLWPAALWSFPSMEWLGRFQWSCGQC